MTFAYKINSSYDRFTPAAIPDRLVRGRLPLGWKRYTDQVERGDEVWVYFRGPDSFTDGVYVFGTVTKVDLDERLVWLRPDEYSTSEPLTEPDISEVVGGVVSVPYRQVFVLPDDLLRVFPCDVLTTGESCEKRRCGSCQGWGRLPRIQRGSLSVPWRLENAGVVAFRPAYWAIAPRSWGWNNEVKQGIRDTSNVFHRFKAGEESLAYPLAKGIARRLRRRDRDGTDYVVPIPLSPEKARANEFHRTRALATELSQLVGVPVRDALSLNRPISKRALGLGADAFERRYAEALDCAGMRPAPSKIILVDDVCTKGSTLAVATRAIHGRYPDCEVVAVTAAQMTMTEAIADTSKLERRSRG